MISLAVGILFDLLVLILIIGALLTWIPRLPIHQQPFKTLMIICDIFFGPFRRIIPPIAGIDFSPILAFIVLQVLCKILLEVLAKYGL